MKNYLVLILVLTSYIAQGQKWTYTSGGNAFDGKYKTSSIIGKGEKSPYKTPILVVNRFEKRNVNIYIGDAGYAGCNGCK